MTAVTLSRVERGYYAWLRAAPGTGRLVAATTDGRIEVWPLDAASAAAGAAGGETPVRPRALSCNLPSVYQLDVRGHLAAVTGPGAVELHDLDRGALVRALQPDGATHYQAVAFTPDGRHLLVAGAERVSAVDIDTDRVVDSWRGGERTPCIAVHPGGALAHIACYQGGSQVVVAALADGARRAGDPRTLDVPSDVCTPGAFSPDGALLAFASRHVQIHRVADLAMTHAFDYWGDPADDRAVATAGSVDGYWSNAAFTPDGRHLVCGSPLGAIIVWDLAAGRAVARHDCHGEGVIALAVAPAGDRVFSCSYDRTLRVCPLL